MLEVEVERLQRVKGTGVDSHGDHVPLAAIYVYDGTRMVGATTADTCGQYELKPLPPGTFTFVAEEPSHARAFRENVLVDGGFATVDIAMADPAVVSGFATVEEAAATNLFVFGEI